MPEDVELNLYLIFHPDGSSRGAHELNAEVRLFDEGIARTGVARLLHGHYYALANTVQG